MPKNIHNSFKLAHKIFLDRHPIGIYQLLLYGFSTVTQPLDKLMAGILFRRPEARRDIDSVFISGYSRSGTTILYQTLSQFWDCEYINNLIVLFPRIYPFANKTYRRLTSYRGAGFRNYYGRTAGLYGNNDGAQLMERWFPEQTIEGAEPISENCRKDMEQFFYRHARLTGKPLLFKNCNLHHRFDLLAEMFAGAHFIFVKRDPRKVIESTLKARRFIQGDAHRMWEFSEHHGRVADPIEEIALNLKAAYGRMDRFAQRHPRRCHMVSYEDFCQNPREIVNGLTRALGMKRLRKSNGDHIFNAIYANSPFVLNNNERIAIAQTVAQLFS